MTRNCNDFDQPQIRLAKSDDAKCLWEWANDSVTRQNSFDSAPISWAAHQAWYAARLSAPDTRIWVLELRGERAGQIRYERSEGDVAQISFSIAPTFRGRGLGAHILRASADLAARELGVAFVEGVVFEENRASINSFINAGFELVQRKAIADHACVIFRRRGLSVAPEGCCGSVR